MDNRQTLDEFLRHNRLDLRPAEILNMPPDPWPVSPDWDRIEGMMLGLAIGDSLGNTSESKKPSERMSLVGEVRDYLPNHHAEGRRVGLPSDDTQLAFWALDQMNQDGGLNLEHMANRFASQRIYGIGGTVRMFLHNLKSGLPWYDCGPRSAGNGALMRIAPMIIPHLRTADEQLWTDTILLAAMTHNDQVSTSSCVAFINILWSLLGMDAPPGPDWWLKTFTEVVYQLSNANCMPRGGQWANNWTGSFGNYVEKIIGEAWDKNASTLDACNSWHSAAYLLETVPSVLYILMRYGHEPEEAIVRAVNDTYDNDTVAAIVGAAVGALHGRRGLPKRWVDGLLGRTSADDDGRIYEILGGAKKQWWET